MCPTENKPLLRWSRCRAGCKREAKEERKSFCTLLPVTLRHMRHHPNINPSTVKACHFHRGCESHLFWGINAYSTLSLHYIPHKRETKNDLRKVPVVANSPVSNLQCFNEITSYNQQNSEPQFPPSLQTQATLIPVSTAKMLTSWWEWFGGWETWVACASPRVFVIMGWASCWKKGGGEAPPRASPWRLEHVKRYDCSIRVTWSRSGEPQTFPMMIGLICQTRISLRERAQPQRHETQTGRTPPIHHTHTHVHLQPQASTDLITRLCVDVTECVEHKPKGLSLTAIFVDF